jgi:transcriptional regulator with XRE-family HTH domain
MSQAIRLATVDLSQLRLVKKISGARIRDERRRRKISQARLGSAIGHTERWMRDVETGNPGIRLDDHLNTSLQLGLPVGHIILPMLLIAHGMPVPQRLLYQDTTELERKCIDLVADAALRELSAQTDNLTPHWWEDRGGCDG